MQDQLWVVTAYFNWCHYESKLKNYNCFKENLAKANINLLTVECALTNDQFELCDENVIHVRTNSLLWQKERLLNVALCALPPHCKYVAWLDCDLLFDASSWEDKVSCLLQRHIAVQLFDTVWRQAKGEPFSSPRTRVDQGLVAHHQMNGETSRTAGKGHPGFAWAARREIISETGLYDKGVVGGADRLIALAWIGNLTSALLERVLPPKALSHFSAWMQDSFKPNQGSIGFLPETIFHLWHGEQADRSYNERHEALKRWDFDPSLDIRKNSDSCWEWCSNKVELHEWVAAYFANRKEDG
jgi:hypothetical protein